MKADPHPAEAELIRASVDDPGSAFAVALRQVGTPTETRAEDESNPRTAARRTRTRVRLLAAARVIFERDGFHAARLSDIVETATVSIGTFYNYYSSKEKIFRDIMNQVGEDLVLVARSGGQWAGDPVKGIEQANLSYVKGYRRNAKLMSLLMQMAEQDVEMRELRLEIRHSFEMRLSTTIARWQREGLAWDDVDPVYAANALAYMVDRFLYEWVMLDLDYDEDKVVDTLTRLWARGLGLERPAVGSAECPAVASADGDGGRRPLPLPPGERS